jgi:protein-tyrosine phosphatase
MPDGWIDLHSHVLPGIDDGAEDLEDALAMAAMAAQSGTEVLAATPHVRSDHPAVVPGELAERVARLNCEIAARAIALRVVVGGEVSLLDALERPDEELRAVTLGGGDTLLVETPLGPLPGNLEGLLASIAARGFRVLLAHPEHSPDLQRTPERLGRLADQGVLLQLTGGSFTSSRRAPWRRAATVALREGWAHVIASDAHSSTWRRPILARGLAAAEEAVPGARAQIEWMARDVPRALLNRGSLPARPSVGEGHRRRGVLSRVFGR